MGRLPLSSQVETAKKAKEEEKRRKQEEEVTDEIVICGERQTEHLAMMYPPQVWCYDITCLAARVQSLFLLEKKADPLFDTQDTLLEKK